MTTEEQKSAATEALAASAAPVASGSGTKCECTCESCASGDCPTCTMLGCDEANCEDCPQQMSFDDVKRTPAQLTAAVIVGTAIRMLSAVPNERRDVPAGATDPSVLTIFIYEDIGYDACWGTGVGAVSVKEQIDQAGPHEKICVRINSLGGDVFEAVTIYNLLRAQGKPIEICIDGIAASAASVVAMAGDTPPKMGPSTMMMIHNASTGAYGYASDFRKQADVLDKVSKAIAYTYAKITGKSMTEIKAIMDAETWLDAADCIKEGFASGLMQESGMEDRAAQAVETSRFARSFKNLPARFKENRRMLTKLNTAGEGRALTAALTETKEVAAKLSASLKEDIKQRAAEAAVRPDGPEKVEVRSCKFEIREAAGDKPAVITGTPIVFRSESQNLGGFVETVEPDAVEFENPLRADFDHDSKYILGTESRGTLKMTKDAAGWHMEATPPDTQWARDLMASIKRGDIDGGSFAFRVQPGGQSWSADGKRRTLTSIVVNRLTITSNPAYLGTNGSFQVRSITDILGDRPEQEQTRTAGQAAPPAINGGGADIDLLRRDLELSLSFE